MLETYPEAPAELLADLSLAAWHAGKPKPPEAKLELSAEEKQRLLERLQELLENKRKYRARLIPRHRPGKKDW
ncbi:MAG: hypothetical protein ACE5F1_03325 [Planctomycetota bacterium]